MSSVWHLGTPGQADLSHSDWRKMVGNNCYFASLFLYMYFALLRHLMQPYLMPLCFLFSLLVFFLVHH